MDLTKADKQDLHVLDAYPDFHANLIGVDMSNADLRGALGDFFSFQLGKYYAVFVGGYGYIDNRSMPYQDWLSSYKALFNRNYYSDDEIELYGKLIKRAIEYLE